MSDDAEPDINTNLCNKTIYAELLFYYNISNGVEMAENNERVVVGGHRDDWSDFNELTLTVMANRNRYDKYKKSMSNTSDALAELFCKEKTYYKDRILAMTSDLFDERCENDEINRAHKEYLKSCIEYLKWNDITDMVEDDTRTDEVRDDVMYARQELHRKIQETDVASPSQPASPSPPASPSQPASPPAPPHPASNTILSFANKMCIRKKTMDDFIVLKPASGNTDEEIKARLPKVRDYHNVIMNRANRGGDTHDYTD